MYCYLTWQKDQTIFGDVYRDMNFEIECHPGLSSWAKSNHMSPSKQETCLPEVRDRCDNWKNGLSNAVVLTLKVGRMWATSRLEMTRK